MTDHDPVRDPSVGSVQEQPDSPEITEESPQPASLLLSMFPI